MIFGWDSLLVCVGDSEKEEKRSKVAAPNEKKFTIRTEEVL
jgi:hypothetical protein